MSVYYILAESVGLIKIGVAENVRGRLGKMQVDCPIELRVVGIEDGGREIEAERHSQFALYRHRGEWFRHEGRLASFVEGLEQPPPEEFFAGKAEGPIGDWMRRNRIGSSDLANLLGVSHTQLWRVFTGQRFARPKLMIALDEISDGEITPDDLLHFYMGKAAARRAAARIPA